LFNFIKKKTDLESRLKEIEDLNEILNFLETYLGFFSFTYYYDIMI